MCVLQCSTHTYYKKKSNSQEGIVPVHPSLFRGRTGWTDPNGRPHAHRAQRRACTDLGVHSGVLFSPPLPPPSPWISVRSICSACAAKSFCFILTESSEQTCPVCAAGLTPDMQMHLISATVLKIELHACACDVGVHVCRNNLVPLCLAEQQRIFLFLPHS